MISDDFFNSLLSLPFRFEIAHGDDWSVDILRGDVDEGANTCKSGNGLARDECFTHTHG